MRLAAGTHELVNETGGRVRVAAFDRPTELHFRGSLRGGALRSPIVGRGAPLPLGGDRDPPLRAHIATQQHLVGRFSQLIVEIHALRRVHDRRGEARIARELQEASVERRASRKAMAHVAHSGECCDAEAVGNRADRVEGRPRPALLRGGGQHQRVGDQIAVGESGGMRRRADALDDRHTVVGRVGDPAVVQGEHDHGRTVPRGQRKHRYQRGFLSAHAVHERPPGIDPQGRLEGDVVGGVDNEWEVNESRECQHHARQHLGLDDTGRPDVHIEKVGAGVGLLHGVLADDVQSACAERLGQPLLARGVDALAHTHERSGGAHANHAARAGHRNAGGRCGAFGRLLLADEVGDRAGELGSGAAARADERRTRVHEARRVLAHLDGRARKDRRAVHELRQSGVGAHDDRQGRGPGHPLDQRQHLLGSEAAVDAHRRCAHRFQDHRGGLGVRAREVHATAEAEGARSEDGQVGDGAGREHGAARLGDVGHRGDVDRVGVLGRERRGLLGECIEEQVERRAAEWLQHQTARTQLSQDVRRPARTRQAHRGAVELGHLVAESVCVELEPRAAERVGSCTVGAGERVETVYLQHEVRGGHVQLYERLLGRQVVPLEHGAHRAV